MPNTDPELPENAKPETKQFIALLETVVIDPMILGTFIRGLTIGAVTKTEAVIVCPDFVTYDYLQSHLQEEVTTAVAKMFGPHLKCQIVVKNGPHDPLLVEKNLPAKNLWPKFNFENYVVADFNREVVEIAHKVIANCGKMNPFFFSSRSGLGKTHLLHAMGNVWAKQGVSVIYIDPNRFTDEIAEMAKQKNAAGGIAKYVADLKQYDVLIFDDVQSLGDRVVTLRVLFDLIKDHIESEKQVVIASDKPIKELSGYEERLITRFAGGISAVIKTPTFDDLTTVLQSKLRWANLHPENWEKEALRFIVRNSSTSIRSLEGAIKRVAFFTEHESNVRYTVQVLANIFKDLEINPLEISPQRILSTVALYYKVNISDLTGKSRKKNFVVPRHMAIWLMRKILDLSLTEIGALFSKRGHPTILASIKKVENDIAVDKTVKMALDKLEQNIKSIN